MSEPIKIVVTAQTAEAAAQLQTFLKSQADGFKAVEQAAHGSEGALSKNRMALMELGHVGRATAEGLAFGLNPLKVLALEAPRIIQATTMMGISLATMTPYVLAVAAAVGAGFLGWRAYMSGVEDSTKATEDFMAAIDKLPAMLKKINDLQSAGLLSPGAAKKFSDQATGRTPLFIGPDGKPTTQSSASPDQIADYARMSGMPIEAARSIFSGGNKPATQQQRQDDVNDQLPAVNDAQIKAIKDRKELELQLHVEVLDGIEKEKQALTDKFQKQRDQILEIAKIEGANFTANGGRDPEVDNRAQADIKLVDQAEQLAIVTAEKKAQVEMDRKDAEWAKAYSEAQAESLRQNQENLAEEQKQRGILAQQLTLKQEIARAENEAKLTAIQGNSLLSDQEKAEQSIPLIQQQIIQNAERIAELNKISADPTTDATGQLQAQKQAYDLQVQQAQLRNNLTDATGENSIGFQFSVAEKSLESMNNMAKEIAGTFSGVFNGAISSISQGLTNVIMMTQTWRQALANIGTSILTSIVQGIIQMGVRWILTQALMAVAGRSILAASVASTVPLAAAQSAIWAVPATLATISSYGGAAIAAPGLIGIAEAITLGTAATGFADGGYTGAGGKYSVAGFVHRGEVVFSQADIARHGGVDNVEGMRKGGSGGKVSVYSYVDPDALQHHLERNDDHEKYIVDVMGRNMHRFT